MARRGSSPVFVGRTNESDRLDAALARAADGQPSLLLIAGEAGVGKSRLTAEFAVRAETRGALVVTGACLDLYQGGVPYAPFVEALRELSKRAKPDARAGLLGPSMETLAGLIPDLRPEPGITPADGGRGRDASDPGARLGRLFDAWLAVLGRASSERPLVLIIEDIHWADGSTRDLIRFLTRNVRDERLLLVVTYRSDDVHRRHPVMPLLVELERADRVERLDLAPLGRDDLAAQLEGILGSTPSASLVESILERSDGLPFYVEELIAAGDHAGSALPRTLRDILERRLVALSDPAMALVRAGAVIGGRIPEDTLAAVSEVTQAALIEGLREAVETHVLVVADGQGPPAYTFRHALLREAAYDDLLPAERVRLHARLADHLDARVRDLAAPDPSVLADIAVHAYAAHDLARAFSGSVRALRALVDVVAFREAMAHAERALELWDQIPDAEAVAGIDHVELLAMAGRMASAANRPMDALAHLQAALTELAGRPSVATPEMERSLQLDLWLCAWEAHANDVATAAVERAYALGIDVPSASSTVEVTMALGVQRWWDGDLRESVRLLEDAVASADAGGDRSVWAEAMTYLAHTRSDLGQGDRASALLDHSEDAFRSGGSGFGLVFSAADRSVTLVTVGRFADAERVAWDGLERARRYGWETRVEHAFRACIADARFELGRYDDAETIAQPVLDGQGIEHTIEWIRGTMARVDVARGRLVRASRLLGGSSPQVNEWTDLNSTPAHVDLARAEGRFDDVLRIVDAVAAELGGEAVMPGWQILALGVRSAAESAGQARQRRRTVAVETAVTAAERWLAALRTIIERGRAEGGAGPWPEATLATAEAEMGHARGTPDAEAWPPVIEQWVALSHPYQTAVARFRMGAAALHRGGGRDTATDALRAAHATAMEIGAEPLRAEIAALAAAARIDLATAPDAGTPDPDRPSAVILTAREGAVMALVAQGHTNREIGDQLFISEKTVSVHVSNAMAKLGALSRYEAAAAAERQGLL